MKWLAISLLAAVAVAPGPTAAWDLRICANPDGAPYSQRDLGGFDNRIAQIVAEELGVEAVFEWMSDHRMRTAQRNLHAGRCDVVMGVMEGQQGFMTTHAYYRTTYVVVTHADTPATASLDDPALAVMRIGLKGGGRTITPPGIGLVRRGLQRNLVNYDVGARPGVAETEMLQALAEGTLDLAILWGPMAGMVAGDRDVALLTPEIDIPFLPMFASISIGVRPRDEALRDALNVALARRWEEVQAILEGAHVPLLSLPQPRLSER